MVLNTYLFLAAGDDKTRIYLLGNPLIWWGNIGFLLIFLAVYSWAAFRQQRGWEEPREEREARDRTLSAAAWLFLGWALHYIPFWTMGRVLYVHHYYPALLFSSMLTGVLMDYLLARLTGLLPARLANTVKHTALGRLSIF
jgi:dolichyl-phosphate-mannose-protein mannosyltransferase